MPLLSSSLPFAPPAVHHKATPGSYPEWVLLDTVASDANYRLKSYAVALASKTTAAEAVVKFKHDMGVGVEVELVVKVSFRLVRPPGISRFVVHCRGLGNDGDGLAHDAHIVSAEGDIVLLYITLAKYEAGRYFVFRAGQGKPSLEVLPCPSSFFNRIKGVGIVPSGNEGYVVATIAPKFVGGVLKYELFLYSSNSKAWSTEVVPLYCDCDVELSYVYNHSTDKVITIGGGSLGWVDLWWGILVCNVFKEEGGHSMRFIQLPERMCSDDSHFEISLGRSCRDVICAGNLIKLVDVEYHRGDRDLHLYNKDIDYGWKATIWERILPSNGWHECCIVDTDDLTVTNERYSCLLPELWDEKAEKLSLSKFICSAPTLSMEDDVFYMMSELNPQDPLAWIAAVNTGHNLVELISFTAELSHCDPTYSPYSFSKHLKVTSGEHMTMEMNLGSRRLPNVRKRPILSVLRTLLSVEKWFMELEDHILSLQRPSSWTVCTDLSTELARIRHCVFSCKTGKDRAMSTICLYTLNRALDDCVAMFQDKEPSVSVETLRVTISCVLGATGSILQDFPPKMLAEAYANCLHDQHSPTPSFRRYFKLTTDRSCRVKPICGNAACQNQKLLHESYRKSLVGFSIEDAGHRVC